MAADFTLLNALAAQQLPKIGTKSGEWEHTIKFLIGQSTIKSNYSATVTKLTLAPVVGKPTQIEGTATISASITAKAKRVFDVSGTGSATATVTAEAVVNESNGLGVRLTGLKPFSLLFSFPGPASGFAAYVETIANVASGVLHDAISAALKQLPLLDVDALPPFDGPIEYDAYVIQIQEPAFRTIQVGGRSFLTALSVPDVQTRAGVT